MRLVDPNPSTMTTAKPGAFGADLAELASYLLTNGPRRVLPAQRRVRVIFNHATIVDSVNGFHVWEHDAYPHYYFPVSEIRQCTTRDRRAVKSDGVSRAAVVELTVHARNGIGEKRTDRVLRFSEDRSLGALAGLVRLEFGSMQQWLEEDLPIHVHPKDPFKRIDILPSSRPIEVRIFGKTVARSPFSVHLLETTLPTRYYLPLGSIDQHLLRKSDLITQCPYKGDAEYYHVVVDGEEARDIAWFYKTPTLESAGIAGMVCFYNEKVDICLDGQLLDRPKTYLS